MASASSSSGPADGRAAGGPDADIQVHPTRRCNLSCTHCYTSSGPREKGELPVGLLEQAVADAFELGYRQLAVSGGEPFLYRDLPRLLAGARAIGMRTSVTTNGTVLGPARLADVVEHLDLLAVSVDGPPADHNLLRASPSAFSRMRQGLATVHTSGVPFGFIFTLTRYNAHQLEWLVGFAEDEGAAGVQIHPLTGMGRARSEMRGAEPDGLELLAARAEAARLAALHPGVAIHVDALTHDELEAAQEQLVPGADAALCDMAPSLIVTDTASVIPITHDIDDSLALGSLIDGRLAELGPRWVRQHGARVAALLASTYDELRTGGVAATFWLDGVASRSRCAVPAA